MALLVVNVNLWKTPEVSNLKHLVMVPNQPTTFCGFLQRTSTNMVLDTSTFRRYS